MERLIRKLAKSTKHQNLFLASKEINGINLFKNNSDFSKIQEIYLSYLYFYNNLFMDIATDKVSKKVIDNEIYEEAYSVYKSKKSDIKDKKESENKQRDLHIVFGK